MNNKDFKRYVKEIIIGIAHYVIHNDYHENFIFDFRGNEAYKLQDKAIDKRVKKYILKKYGLRTEVYTEREYYCSVNAEMPLLLTIRVSILKRNLDGYKLRYDIYEDKLYLE